MRPAAAGFTLRAMNLPAADAESPPPSPAAPAGTLALLADALSIPLLLLRSDGTLLYANLAGRRLLGRGQPMRLTSEQVLLPAVAPRGMTFAAALQAAFADGHLHVLQWPRSGATPPMLATLVALGAAPGESGLVLLALVTGEQRAAEVQAYADLHGLCTAESRLLHRLALGDSSTRAARALGLSTAAVRSQTTALRRKTGCSSVAALMQSLATLPPLAAVAAGIRGE